MALKDEVRVKINTQLKKKKKKEDRASRGLAQFPKVPYIYLCLSMNTQG